MQWMRVLLLTLVLPFTSQADKGISLVLDDAPISQVLQALAETQRVNLLIAPGVEGVLSLNLINVPWKQAFQLVLNSAELTQQRDGNVIQILSKARQREQQALAMEQRKQLTLNQPMLQQVFAPHHADVEELASALKSAGAKLMSAMGYVTVDKRTNRLIVHDNKDVLKQITAWIAEMDLPIGQVEIEAHIVTINQDKLRELGVKWSAAEQTGESKIYQPTGISADLSVANATTKVGFNIARIDGRLLELELSALEQQQQLEIIASPRLMAAHQQPASIKQGTEIPYQVSSGESGATAIEFKEAVLGMEVTPTIQPHGNIRLKLRISQNMPGRSIQQADGEVLAIDKQEIETVVAVKDGETLALGGIFQQQNKDSNDSVPILGSLPLVGSLFRHDAKNHQRRELVVFITPRLIPVL
ncbi:MULTISPECIES: type IV pilus secretin PilQ [Buttiauxella]|uniref:PilQ family type IV pilus biogenesis protein n=1 Tax=Buttiauxella ferragutiae ATCC 51602 TaxID=1354252 RepID=A0ABX2WBD4_9ENTR|nr:MULTISPECIES: type IV pilus secretin PilQ [Buttiauxella]AYN28538.1 DNA transporter HofQ [Buttiauxella sp. 3AFRM03]MCE0827914.1 type IV pilus secretin PilQ [Buttiauxella ferragutiae]OAT29841.1 PilQ family type IV pilus biogenesis protein [Buttiauxella ferragutiae ATCC 51602]TDN52670.1 protein transport protein HofQ [Buttiauxella sp. JUb87]UNK61670.1 type IV pilus secretin PilQ [Buttiauxella ferragutiae]